MEKHFDFDSFHFCVHLPHFCDTREDSVASPWSSWQHRWDWECCLPPHEPPGLPLSPQPPLKLRRVNPHLEEKQSLRCLSLFSQKYYSRCFKRRFKDLRRKSWNPSFVSSKKCIHKHLKIWFYKIKNFPQCEKCFSDFSIEMILKENCAMSRLFEWISYFILYDTQIKELK